MPWQMTRVFLLTSMLMVFILAAATTIFAASVSPGAEMMSNLLSARMRRPSSTSVPSSRTTSGILNFTGGVGLQQGIGDRRAAHDAAENVHQHGLHLGVADQNAKGLGHLLHVGPAAHVEEIGRLAAVELDEVHRAHGQPGAVDQAADVAVQLHEAQARLARADFRRLLFRQVAQGRQIRDAGTGRCRQRSSWRPGPAGGCRPSAPAG